jgi:hypothetical protein
MTFQDSKHFINKSYFRLNAVICLPQTLRPFCPQGYSPRLTPRYSDVSWQFVEYRVLGIFRVPKRVPSLTTTLCAKIYYGLFVLQLLSCVQPVPGTNPAFSTVGIGSFQGVKVTGNEVHITLHLAPRLKKQYR